MNGKTRAITPLSGSESDDSDIVEIKTDQHKGEKLAGWAYLGSHNFTPSAWGTLSGSSFNPSLNVSTIIKFALSCAHAVNAFASSGFSGLRKEYLEPQ